MARYDIATATYPIDEATDREHSDSLKMMHAQSHTPLMDMIRAELEAISADAGQPEHYEKIRESARDLALLIASECPPSVERDLALAKLDSVVMHANAAIARYE